MSRISMDYFMFFLAGAVGVVITAGALLTSWGGTGPWNVFTWHVVCMGLAWPCLAVLGYWAYKADGGAEKETRRSAHMLSMLGVAGLSAAGYFFVSWINRLESIRRAAAVNRNGVYACIYRNGVEPQVLVLAIGLVSFTPHRLLWVPSTRSPQELLAGFGPRVFVLFVKARNPFQVVSKGSPKSHHLCGSPSMAHIRKLGLAFMPREFEDTKHGA